MLILGWSKEKRWPAKYWISSNKIALNFYGAIQINSKVKGILEVFVFPI